MKWALLGLLCAAPEAGLTQSTPVITVRLSVLLVPITPLVSIECRTVGRFTLQSETNFQHTHGLNLKYYTQTPLAGPYAFVGSALVSSALLRRDGAGTWLPYAGGGYAHVFGSDWVFDGRLGVGPTLNADKNSVYPVIKVGVGKRF
ncbi:hypothetical protein [Fibrella aquatilis]|uniref:DUF3575 domain-containing protein n=1 Tax=Fibrella aquatilis TaxID=2817059 RepID=A0A939G8N0_9BACT|nr:hypothetical protein [Fibrella aquatilis]MBO0934467.1 hypothetical protein [Fibrella aquatilis]